jgi:hypothetical protein
MDADKLSRPAFQHCTSAFCVNIEGWFIKKRKLSLIIQWKLPNVITLGPRETGNINRMITITLFQTVVYCSLVNGTFGMITISS